MDLFSGDDTTGGGGQIETVRLHEATSARYLNYALSVITSRALPDARDGLKPVQRRILYGMYHDLKLRKDSRYLKSARVVGDVMGKYHPHGDSSIYEAMVRMAQSFALRYPMVDGQGNFGSVDGDSAAAMRYTEARIQAIAEELLSELGQDTVTFRPTYDGQLEEPVVLPAQVPNLLINGATGIAVGMATNVPPHNLPEVIDALVRLIDDDDAGMEAVLEHIKGPDFPTGGEILSTADEIAHIYAKGQGAIKLRGTYEEEVINRKRCVIITSIPYMLNKATLVEKIADLIISKKLPQVVDIRDESTDDTRIVMELKRGASPEAAMAYIYKYTPLQGNFHVNLTCLLPTDNPMVSAPSRVSLLELLHCFLDFRMEVVTRRLENRLGKVRKRIHRLEGFEKVFDILDEIIRIIRASEGKADAARKIIKRLDLDAEQTDAILELRLYRLAKLEILKIQEELADLRREAALLEGQLSNEAARWQIVREELLEIRDSYGDARRTKVVGPKVVVEFNPEAYIVRENAWVIITRQGRIKRQKGFSDLSAIRVPDGDEVGWALRTNTRHTVALYTQFGRAYVVRVADVSATTGYGDPLQALFNFSDGERVVGVTSSDPALHPFITEAEIQAGLFEDGQIDEVPDVNEDAPPPYAVGVSLKGKISRFSQSSHHEVSNKSGRRFMSLAKDDEVVAVFASRGDENVCLATRGGRVTLFEVHQVPPKSSAVRGVNAIRLDARDSVLGFCLARKKREGLVCETNRGREVIVRETSYKPVKRGGKGTIVIRLGKLEKCEWPPLVIEPESEEPDPPKADEEGTS